jgi:hypothetical protein
MIFGALHEPAESRAASLPPDAAEPRKQGARHSQTHGESPMPRNPGGKPGVEKPPLRRKRWCFGILKNARTPAPTPGLNDRRLRHLLRVFK